MIEELVQAYLATIRNGDPDSRILAAALLKYMDDDREDVALLARKAYADGYALREDDTDGLVLAFGIEVGKLLTALDYPISPSHAVDLVEWKRSADRNRKNSGEYNEGLCEVKGRACGYAKAYTHLLDPDDSMRITELSGIVLDYLHRTYAPPHPYYRHLPKGEKSAENTIKKWISDSVPDYVKKGGRPKGK